MSKVNVTAVYLLDNGGMDKEHLQKTVSAPSTHVGEVEMAIADTHGVDYRKVTVVKMWKA